MRVIICLLVGMLFLNSTLFAQTITEGKITYTVAFNSSDPEMDSQLGMLSGSELLIYFAPNCVRTEMNLGSVMKTVIIQNKQDDLMLIDAMMGGMKVASKNTLVEMEQKSIDSHGEAKIEVEKTDETRTIAGLESSKYHIISEDGTLSVCWATSELQHIPQNSLKNFGFLSKIDAFPLEYEFKTPDFSMILTAKTIDRGITKSEKKSLFSMKVPKEYKELTAQELETLGIK